MENQNEKPQNKSIERNREMLTAPVGRLTLKMAYPTIIAFLITSIYNLADTYFVSGLGTNATAAVSVNASLDNLIFMGGSLFAVGAASYISRLLGAGDQKQANKVLSTSFFTAMAFGLLILIFGLIFIEPLVRLLGATDSCINYSIEYATYVLWVAPLMAANFVMNQCLRSEGRALLSMLGMGFGGLLNCFLDPFFIMENVTIFGLTFNGLGLGVAGASIATAISKLVSFIILIAPYLLKQCTLKLSFRCITFTRTIIKEVATVGSSALFRNGLNVVSAIILNNIAGNISDSLLAAVGVSTKIMMFPFGFILGYGNGFQPVAGFAWGARDFKRVRKSYSFAWKSAVIGAAVMAAALAIYSDFVIGLFTETDEEMLRLGSLCIITQCIALPIHAWVAIVNMYCSSLGYGFGAILLAISRQGLCFLPIVFPLAAIWKAEGVCYVQAVADILSIFLAIPMLIHIFRMIEKEKAIDAAQPAPAMGK